MDVLTREERNDIKLVLDEAHREIERVSAENARLTARITKAIDRINACPTLDDPDAMIACISDVEVILETSLKRRLR